MPKKSWVVQLEDGPHTIEMEHNIFSNKRVIRVDGQVVERGKFSAFDFGGDYPFFIGERQAVLHMRMNGVQYKYDISIDGRSVQTGQPVVKLQAMPKWVWIFIVACGISPVVTLGGLIPVLMGLGGAWACVVISRNPMRSASAKVLWATGITLAAWALLIGIISPLAGGRTLLTLGQPIWQEYRSQAGRYSILMPGKPQEQTQSVDSAAGPSEMYIASVEDQSGAYLVMYVDYPAGLLRSGQANDILDGAVQEGADNVNGKLTRQQNFPLNTIPGREAEIDVPAQGAQPATRIRSRYFLAHNRLYQVMVIVRQNQVLPDAAQKFLDSFKLVEN